jgi:hypothetical protein
MQTQKDRYYRTNSLSLAIYLYVKNQQIAGINEVMHSEKKEFAFVLSEQLEKLIELYKFGERTDSDLLVPVHLYERARTELLDRLNGN